MNRFKFALSISALSIFLSMPAVAAVRYELDSFMPKGPKSELGIIGASGYTYVKAGLQHDFELGPVALGLDAKLYLPTQEGAPYPTDFQFITVRQASYTHNDIAKLEYGRLENVTYGYGLLLDDYNSAIGGDSGEFTYRKSGLKARLTLNPVQIDALGTGGSLYAGRISYELPGITVFDSPIKVGGTYVTDEDGINDRLTNGSVNRQKQSGYGIDVGIPIAGDFMVAYTEYAKLTDYGDGLSAGVKGNLIDLLKYRAEYRSFSKDFMPGYFNTIYEATSFDPKRNFPDHSEQGGLLGLSVGNPEFMPIAAGVQWEIYGDRALVTAAAGWTGIWGTHGVINYTVPFQNSANTVVDTSIYFESGNLFDYVITARRIHFSDNTYTESISGGVQIKTERLFSSIL